MPRYPTNLYLPYAAKALAEYRCDGDLTYIYLTFNEPMKNSVTPPMGLFQTLLNGSPENVIAIQWIDAFTLELLYDVQDVKFYNKIKYNGPHPNLCTHYNKQWEPWGWTWCHIID